jgi:hypothetical protein
MILEIVGVEARRQRHLSAGSNIPAKMAMIAMTTSNSINVKPVVGNCLFVASEFKVICFSPVVILRACALTLFSVKR